MMSARLRVRILVWTVGLVLASCGASAHPREGRSDTRSPRTLYPSAEGNVWSFDVDDGSGEPLLVVARVVRATGTRFEVSMGGGEAIAYEIRSDGIVRLDLDAYLLKEPVRVGAQWPSGNGRTARVVATDEAVSTPSGDLDGCVRIEERGGEPDRMVVTVYCPGVGPAFVDSRLKLDASRTEARVTATLRGWSLADRNVNPSRD